MAAKKTKGRQKIEIKKIENEDDRLITFSKRRSGIYKKGHHTPLNQQPHDNTHPLVEAHRHVRINELNQQHNELLRQLDEEKELEKNLKQMRRGNETQLH
ncbi:hypothetical protein CICLE_v10006559mg [Citrus x clementina]|uniref:MADS-box domain-containing protein n=2 Tax=Citrus TaxID=2706 RepID=V4SC80_CITCL|nr:hypothetical protein CICLE_v10006559mg [Citrus x clementina]GAY64397.1 hypothetical protein CUMW_233220 [Citrus unshiu]